MMMNLLLTWLWQGLLIAAAATVAVRLVPAGAASKRHAIWWLALLLVIAAPLASVSSMSASSPLSGSAVVEAAVESAAPATFVIPPPPSWLTSALLALWALTALVALARIALHLRQLRTLTRHARPLNPAREAQLTRWLEAHDTSRPARLRVSDQIRGACAVGFLEPTLLISTDLVKTLDTDALDAIVLHEYAHLERYDDWTRLLQRVVLAVTRLHPGVWWISRHIDLEREVACDQRVVRRTGEATLYARSLAEAATVIARGGRRTPALAPGSSTTGSMLMRRVERLLSRRAPSAGVAWSGAASSVVALTVATFVAAQASSLVIFAALPTALLDTARVWTHELAQLPSAGGLAMANDEPSPLASAPLPASPPLLPASATALGIVGLAVTAIPVAPQTPSSPPVEPPSVEAIAAAHHSGMLHATPVAVSSMLPDTGYVGTGHSLATPFVHIGAAAATVGIATAVAGVATGQGASRAGTSIGRWFRDRGVGLARTF